LFVVTLDPNIGPVRLHFPISFNTQEFTNLFQNVSQVGHFLLQAIQPGTVADTMGLKLGFHLVEFFL
jgi:hypothetical protein